MDVLRLTLRQLQIFVAVADSGSTAAASARIALSQSATSSAVNELERLLGAGLFDRSGKRLVLNDNGRTLLPAARSLIDGAIGIERTLAEGAAQAAALLIGASTTIGNYRLPRLLADFRGSLAKQPEATLSGSKIVVGNTAAICKAVNAFELDIGLIEGPCHEPDLQVTAWQQDDLVLVAAPIADREAGLPGPRPSLATLKGATWLLRESGSGTRDATDQWLLPHLQSYRQTIEFGSSESIKHAAIAGLGVAALSRWVVQDMLDSERLRALSPPFAESSRQCYWVIHRDKRPSRALANFVAYLGGAA